MPLLSESPLIAFVSVERGRKITLSPLIGMTRNLLWVFLAMSRSARHKDHNSMLYYLSYFPSIDFIFLVKCVTLSSLVGMTQNLMGIFLEIRRRALHKNHNCTLCCFMLFFFHWFLSAVLVQSIMLSLFLGMARNLVCIMVSYDDMKCSATRTVTPLHTDLELFRFDFICAFFPEQNLVTFCWNDSSVMNLNFKNFCQNWCIGNMSKQFLWHSKLYKQVFSSKIHPREK